MTRQRHVVYLITIGDLFYVGRTCDFSNRKRGHLNSLKRGVHINRKMQAAFNQCGLESVEFLILESDISTSRITERERYWIEEFNSIEDGLNIAPTGVTKPTLNAACEWNGIQYNNIAAAARAIGIEYSALYHRLLCGYKQDSDVGRGKEVYWNGIQYKSIQSAAKAVGVHASTMIRWIARGYVDEQDVTMNRRANKLATAARGARNFNSKALVWDGVEYESIAAAAKATGTSATTLRVWVSKGYTNNQEVIEGTLKNRGIGRRTQFETFRREDKAS